MYAIYGNIYHPYTPNVSIYTIHGSYGLKHAKPHYTTCINQATYEIQQRPASGLRLRHALVRDMKAYGNGGSLKMGVTTRGGGFSTVLTRFIVLQFWPLIFVIAV